MPECLLEASVVPLSLNLRFLVTVAVPLALAILTLVVAHSARHSRMFFFVILTNLFHPTIVAALARFLPCFHLQAKDLQAPPYFRSFQPELECLSYSDLCIRWALIAIYALVTPACWIWLMHNSADQQSNQQYIQWINERRKQALAFLAAPYEKGAPARFSEAFVLVRRTALAVIIATLPASYMPETRIVVALALLTSAMVWHVAILPFQERVFNVLESGSLVVSVIAALFATYTIADSWAQNEDAEMVVMCIAYALLILYAIFLVTLLIMTKLSDWCRWLQWWLWWR